METPNQTENAQTAQQETAASGNEFDAARTLKTLLGIKDGEQDGLLSFLIDDTVNMILGYCRIDEMPEKLMSLVPIIAADMYRAKGYGSGESPSIVKSVSEGERSVSFTDSSPGNDFFKNYYERLRPFINRRGRVPSDLG